MDDIVNAGWSLRQTTDAVRGAGGTVVGGACLVTRGNVDATGLGLDPFTWLLEHRIPAWPEADCHLCRTGVPVNPHYAHGRDWLARRGG